MLRLHQSILDLLACVLNVDTDYERKEVEGEVKCKVNRGEESNRLLAAGAQRQHQSHLDDSLLIRRTRSCYYVQRVLRDEL